MWFAENWSYVLLWIVILGVAGFAIYQKRTNAKEWLRWAVTQAETYFGHETGQLKLRMVYDMFVKQFPWFSIIIPFETFSKWVDEALEWMKGQLDCNDAFFRIVRGCEREEDEKECQKNKSLSPR